MADRIVYLASGIIVWNMTHHEIIQGKNDNSFEQDRGTCIFDVLAMETPRFCIKPPMLAYNGHIASPYPPAIVILSPFLCCHLNPRLSRGELSPQLTACQIPVLWSEIFVATIMTALVAMLI